MGEDGANKFDLISGCRFATNTIIARYRMIISLLEEEQEIEENQSDPRDAIPTHEIPDEPIYEIATIENPNKPKP